MTNIEYIIFTRSIAGIGGAEIYTRNKLLYLEKFSNKVHILSSRKGCSKIDELKKYKDNIIPECINDPFLYSKKQREIILNKRKVL